MPGLAGWLTDHPRLSTQAGRPQFTQEVSHPKIHLFQNKKCIKTKQKIQANQNPFVYYLAYFPHPLFRTLHTLPTSTYRAFRRLLFHHLRTTPTSTYRAYQRTPHPQSAACRTPAGAPEARGPWLWEATGGHQDRRQGQECSPGISVLYRLMRKPKKSNLATLHFAEYSR